MEESASSEIRMKKSVSLGRELGTSQEYEPVLSMAAVPR
jgi:hypothetical protein